MKPRDPTLSSFFAFGAMSGNTLQTAVSGCPVRSNARDFNTTIVWTIFVAVFVWAVANALWLMIMAVLFGDNCIMDNRNGGIFPPQPLSTAHFSEADSHRMIHTYDLTEGSARPIVHALTHP